MNKLIYIIPIILFFASCTKKKKIQPETQAQICARLYPCETVKDSIKYDTIYKESPPQYVVKTEKVIVKGDTITTEKTDTFYSIPAERIITKTVIRTVKDSALIQSYIDNKNALERRILASDKEIGEQKLTINKIKGNRTNWIISSIAGWLLVLSFIAFFIYVLRHNKK